ncbi:homeobox protein vex1-like [Ptychodera flava]|uniref:homeobox protein vex1-like n=1 Tax=Ptychodera flava TaxID=63121 RepID=UPI003969E727
MGYRVEDLIAPSDPHTHCSNHYRRDHHQIPFTVSYDAVVSSASVPTSSPAVLPRIVATQIIIPPQTTTSFHPPSQAFHSTPVVADCTRVSHPSPYVCRTINYQQLPLTSQAISDRHPEANTLQDFRSSVPPMSAVVVRPSNQERRTNSPTHYRRRIRVKFTQKQLKTMNEEFDKKSYINKKERRELSKILDVSETQIKNFWQNKRMKAKQKKLQLKKKVTEEKTQVS